jgi:2-polyprenyl-3-methyl-5-hydroxy-6-metoxy-1,4-benzoquinol methylase
VTKLPVVPVGKALFPGDDQAEGGSMPTLITKAHLTGAAKLRRYGMKLFSPPFLEELHRGLIGREPDRESLEKWVSQLRADRPLREIILEMHAPATVEELYRGTFYPPPDPKEREPDPESLENWVSQLRAGKPLRETVREMHASATVEELYRGIFDRPPDPKGRDHWIQVMREGRALRQVLAEMLSSHEFRSSRARVIKQSELPDINQELPRPCVTGAGLDTFVHHVLEIKHDEEFDLLQSLIVRHRFYDSVGGWAYAIDLDKRVTAAIVTGLGAASCLDVGCSNGPVISQLADRGLAVAGIDLSHLAFALAYPNIRAQMNFGDLLTTTFDRKFDVVVAMDVFEHISPLKVSEHIRRAAALVERNGYLLVNSPMFGKDPVFGTPFPLHLEQWTREPQSTFWLHIPCYDSGWPVDGHLIWAPVAYWEQQFNAVGLMRDLEIETALQHALSGFFAEFAPARKALFVLRWPDNSRPSADVARDVVRAVAQVEGLPGGQDIGFSPLQSRPGSAAPVPEPTANQPEM